MNGHPILSYQRLADLHRPTDHAVLAQEVTKLARSGLTPRDIAAAMRISVGAVLELLKAKAS